MRCEICRRKSRGPLCKRHIRSHILFKDGIIIKRSGRNLSRPQKDVIKHFRELGYDVLFEVYFPWCRDKARLPFDIVFPKDKVIIEYDGPQHFKWVKFFHKTKRAWQKSIYHDRLKESLAKRKGWKLFRISCFNMACDLLKAEDYLGKHRKI